MAKQAIDGVATSKIFNVPPEDLTIIGLDTEHGPGEHYLYDERVLLPLREPDVLNIMALGVQVPVKIIKASLNGSEDEDVLIVVEGRQRVRQAREANKRFERLGEPVMTVPCSPPIRAEEGRIVSTMISLNEHRQDDDVVAKSIKLCRLLERNPDEALAASTFGVSEGTVQNWKVLGTAPKELHSAIRNGKLSLVQAYRLARRTPEKILSVLERLGEEKAPSRNSERVKFTSEVVREISYADREAGVTGAKAKKVNTIVFEQEGLIIILEGDALPKGKKVRVSVTIPKEEAEGEEE